MEKSTDEYKEFKTRSKNFGHLITIGLLEQISIILNSPQLNENDDDILKIVKLIPETDDVKKLLKTYDVKNLHYLKDTSELHNIDKWMEYIDGIIIVKKNTDSVDSTTPSEMGGSRVR